jgi:hypothetical protein
LESKRGGEEHLHMHKSFSNATFLPLYRSETRGPMQRMTPVLPQVWQLISSPSRAIRTPWIEIKADAEVTTPSAVVRAPKVM